MALITLITITLIAPMMKPKGSNELIEVDTKKLFKKN